MGRIIISEFITVDGVTEAPGGEPGHKYTGWSLDYFNDDYLQYKLKETLETDALLLGRKTYEGFAEAWPERTDEMGFADKMNNMPKYVVSTSLTQASWNNTTIINRDVVKQIQELKNEIAGSILIAGSSTLAQTLMEHNLIDEYRLMIHPTILGTGMKLYRETSKRINLSLKQIISFTTSVVVLEYTKTLN